MKVITKNIKEFGYCAGRCFILVITFDDNVIILVDNDIIFDDKFFRQKKYVQISMIYLELVCSWAL